MADGVTSSVDADVLRVLDRVPVNTVPDVVARMWPACTSAWAGMNAHINRDLPLAVVRTCEARRVVPHRGSPRQADCDRVNGILEAGEIRAMEAMGTGGGS